ncbi:MAG: hypothetical protein JNM41_08625 [Flavipsychrobacter sp.]|nr:hypothetical protein [Flavipsychrobacter sp.]
MQKLNDFFENYASALERYDTKSLAYMYNIPCTMLSDEATTVFNDAGKLEGFFNQGASFYRQFGIAHVRQEIWMKRHLSDRIATVKVNWQFFDALNAPIYDCDYQYTMKLDKNNQWRIILSVSINEKKNMEEWQTRMKNELVNRFG